MSKINWSEWDNTQEAGFIALEKGAYICEIKAIKDVEDKQYVNIEFDIVDAKYKDYYKNLKNSDGTWAYDAQLYRSYKADHYSFLKRWVTILEKSNSGYNFRGTNGDFAKWIGLRFVGVFGAKEIPVADDNNNPKVYVKLRDVRSIEALQKGDVKVPDDIERLNDFEQNMFKEKYQALRVATKEESREILNQEVPTAATENKYPF